MTLQDAMVESPTLNRRQPLLSGNFEAIRDEKENGSGRRIREVAGGTAAECAAVCCCCPCAVMHLIVLAVYRVPAGLCKRALKKSRRKKLQKKKKRDLEEENQWMKTDGSDAIKACGGDESDLVDNHKGAVDLDSEMWDLFYGAGFWRSFSRREENEGRSDKNI